MGEVYDSKYLTTNQEDYKVSEMKGNKMDGKFMRWNNYTGEFIEKGFYKNGKKNKEWTCIYPGDTLIQNYKNDTLNGFYKNIKKKYRNYQISTIGSYDMGKASGLWKHNNTIDSVYKEEVFMDNEKYLITYIHKNKKIIEQGSGIITTSEEGLITKTEEYYKEGKIFKTVLIYTQNNEIASVIYNTSHGDSIAYYMPPESGTCIKNGTGMKTYFDSQKRISIIEYYMKGKIIKHDIYYNGQLDATYYFHYMGDTSKRSLNVKFEKDVTKLNNQDDQLLVTLRISNIPKTTSVIYLCDNYSALTSYEIEISNSVYYTIKKEGHNLILQPKKTPVQATIEIKYKMPYYPAIRYEDTHLTIYTTDRKLVDTSLYPIKQ